MQEIEVKAALRDKDAVLGKLASLAVTFGEPVTQDDTVYVAKTGTVQEFLGNTLFLRLRTQNDGKVTFTAKYHENREAANDTYATEYELGVSSREAMEEILKLQGYQPAVSIKKSRRTGTFNEWEICIDEVESLGSFIEVEQLAPDGADPKQIYDLLCEFLYTLGIAPEDITTTRYDIMLLNTVNPGIYVHLKDLVAGTDKRYEFIGMAIHTETGEDMVLYKPLYTPAAAAYFVRPLAMFIEEVDKPDLGYRGPRFVRAEE